MLSFFRSFRFAAHGLLLCLRERNFRFHLALAIYMYTFLLIFDWFTLTRGEWAALILATVFVLAAEAFNTAIEATVDLASPDIHPLAARAKDLGAAAVLVCAAAAVAVGLVVLWQPAAFSAMLAHYQARPVMLAPLGLSLVGATWFIWGVGRKKL